MKVVHLVIGGDVAGGQMVALQLARAARSAGHDVAFVSPSDGDFVALARSEGFEVVILPFSGALDLPAVVRLARALRQERAGLVHVHAHFGGNVVGRLAARLAGIPVISHMHIENVFRAGFGRRAQVALDNLTARLCRRIVAVSEATRAALVRQGYPARLLVTVHNGVEPARAQPTRVQDVPAQAALAGVVARLCEVKGQRELIRALDGLDAWAVLIGKDMETGGAFQAALEREAEALGVRDRVVFAGFREDVPSLLAGLDVYVLPSTVEGLPMTVLEAMAQARPVVATDVGGTAELVVDGETGILIPPGDAGALREALRRLLADPELRRTMGEAGRRRVEERFSAAAMAERVLALYDEVRR